VGSASALAHQVLTNDNVARLGSNGNGLILLEVGCGQEWDCRSPDYVAPSAAGAVEDALRQ
jgi:hypothetical protein